ncbi:MAG: hemolysin family protein [Gemmatimonadota bacterium]|nr:hemolysin family protein [Gemmatimonadota bacterium]
MVVAVLIFLTGLYVAAEFAAVSVRRSRIRQRAEQGDNKARLLLPVIENARELDHYIAASQIGITLTSLIVGAYSQATIAVELQPLFEQWGGMTPTAARSTATVVVLVVLTVLAMILGELVPKSLALQFPTQTALSTVLPMRWSLTLFSGFISFLNGSGALILRLLGAKQAGHRHIHSPDEIDLLIAESRAGGLLDPDEHRRLRRALQLGIRPARHLMVPRPQITALEIGTPIPEVVRVVSESPYTRIPVYRGSIDHVVGLLHTRDLFTRYLEGRPTTLEVLLRPILIVHESITADRLLSLMRERKSHQAIVADEFGGVAGLVTLEDVLTEVMGDVPEELKHEESQPEHLPDGRVRLPGWLRLDEAEPWLGAYLRGEADTLGGRVMEELGHLPESGETVVIEGVEMEVEAVENHVVASVLARPLAVGEGEEE